jgi:maleylacetate reductase
MLSGVYRFPPMESVIYGRPFAEAVKEQVEQSGATAVFLLASGTLARETGLVGQIRGALGNRLAGMHARIGAHTPRTNVVDAANAARPLVDPGRRFGDGRRQDGCVLPRQPRHRPRAAR